MADAEARARFAEAGRKRLEEFRRLKAAQQDTKAVPAAQPPLEPPPPVMFQPQAAPAVPAAKPQVPQQVVSPPALRRQEAAPITDFSSHEVTLEQQPSIPAPYSPASHVADSLYNSENDQQQQPQPQLVGSLVNALDSSLPLPLPASSANIHYGEGYNNGEYSELQQQQQGDSEPWIAPSAPAAVTATAIATARPSWLASTSLPSWSRSTEPVHVVDNITTNSMATNSTTTAVIRDSGVVVSSEKELEEEEEEEALTSEAGIGGGGENDKATATAGEASVSSETQREAPLRSALDGHKLESVINPKAKDFKDLQLHIDELTEEKFTLQRCLEQQTLLADRLADENEALARKLNEASGEVETAGRELEAIRRESAQGRSAVRDAQAERDAYEMSAREASERVKSLAAEVVGLEEKVLKYRSEELKRGSEKEKEKDSGGAASEAIRVLQVKLDNGAKERNRLEDEVQKLQEEMSQWKFEAHRAREAAQIAHEAQAAAELAAAAAIEAQESLRVKQQQQQQHAAAHQDGSTATHSSSKIREAAASLLHPPHSAFIAAGAMEQYEAAAAVAHSHEDNGSGLNGSGLSNVESDNEGSSAIPLHVRALLPAVTWLPENPGAERQLDPGVAPVVERIFTALETLEKERDDVVRAFMQQGEEAEVLKAMNFQLQGRLQAMQAQIELGAQQRAAEATASHK